MMDTDIETKLRQGPEVTISFPHLVDLLPFQAYLYHRTDYYEDNSQSEYYGLELSEEQFKLVKKIIAKKTR